MCCKCNGFDSTSDEQHKVIILAKSEWCCQRKLSSGLVDCSMQEKMLQLEYRESRYGRGREERVIVR